MKLRPAQGKDATRIAALWHEGWHVGHADVVPGELVARRTPEEFATRTQSHLEHTWVADIDDDIGGFIMVTGQELYQFYVSGTQRGKGLAARLMQGFEELVEPGTYWLACSVGNERAARFYEKAGWSRTRTDPYDLETGQGPLTIDVWIYEKTIAVPPGNG